MSVRREDFARLSRTARAGALALAVGCQPVAPAGPTPESEPLASDTLSLAPPPPVELPSGERSMPQDARPRAAEIPAVGPDTAARAARDTASATRGRGGGAPSVGPRALPVPVTAGVDSVPRLPRSPVDVSTAQRFEILDVGDSTLRFLARRAAWLDSGVNGIVVDPRRRDVLVARFEVVRRLGDTATALVTGQTQRVVPEHVALVARPVDTVVVVQTEIARRPRTRFWEGVLAGVAAGVLGALVLR